jgi:hypothetical protein
MTRATGIYFAGRENLRSGELPHEQDSRDRANRIGVSRHVLRNSKDVNPGRKPRYRSSTSGIGRRWKRPYAHMPRKSLQIEI